jgi:cell wall-associated NlpC family hydrolase
VPYRVRARLIRALPRVLAGVTALATVATVTAATSAAAPGHPKPPRVNGKPVDPALSHRIDKVTAQLARLSQRNDQLDEQYNLAAAAVAKSQRAATSARRAADDAAARYEVAHAEFVQAVTQQYESGPAPSVGSLLTSAAPQQYLDGLTMDSYLSSRFGDTVHAEQVLHADAVAAADQASTALTAARVKEAALAQRRVALRAQAKRFHDLLDSLSARQRRELAHARQVAAARAQAALTGAASSAQTLAGPAPNRAAGPEPAGIERVIAFAEAQVGKPYSYASSGPYSYDCSGLTMASYAQIGIYLPHSAAEQYNYGTHVAYSQLQPGDLIFLYSPIGHVELYVGHDLAVSAANPATGIVYVHPSQDMGSYVGATRLTG